MWHEGGILMLCTLGRKALSIISVTAGTITLVLGTATSASGAENVILVPGATVFKQINPDYPDLAATYPFIGINFHGDVDAQVIDYSQNALASDIAIADGVTKTGAALATTEPPVAVIGESMGSMVAARLAKSLSESPDPPLPDQIRFVLIAPPEAGIGRYFSEGTHIPVLNYVVSRIPDTPYDTTVVIGEYDGWADPPDRPWNLIASANAVMGVFHVHGPPAFVVDPATVPPENVTVATNSAGGTVTTYLAPTEELPLTQPLRSIGMPDSWVDQVDEVLRPMIDSAYLRHDEPGDTRPYFSEGKIHPNVQAPQASLDVLGQEPDLDIESQAVAADDQHAGLDVQGRLEHRNVRSTAEAAESEQGSKQDAEDQERDAESGQGTRADPQEVGDERQDGGTERGARQGGARRAQSTEPRAESTQHNREADTNDAAA